MSGQPTAAFQPMEPMRDTSRYSIPPDAMATIVIFGATGDLTERKLLPAIYNLAAAEFLPKRFAVVGVARRPKTDNEWREEMCEGLKKFSRTGHGADDACEPFVSNLFYHQLDFAHQDDFSDLERRLREIEEKMGLPGNRLFYLATLPELFAPVVQKLGRAGMIRGAGDEHWSRVVVEKPFGHDLDSAIRLNEELKSVLREDQIYRIDHYLGKETVQNIFAFRFGNSIFEPLFHRNYVDHVQITVAETVGVEGRGEFYDKTGSMRDVVQNHCLQLMCLVAMEPPPAFGAKEVRDEKVKVLSSVTLPEGDPATWIARGQYAGDRQTPGYLTEEGVAEDSKTETFVALRLGIDNWRWAGVPFFIRSGKQLKAKVTEIALRFKQPPTDFFQKLGIPLPAANALVFRIQPNEAILLSLNAKPPGMSFQIQSVDLDFHYEQTFQEAIPEAYERLILDAMRGDSTLFTRADEVEQAWRIVTDIMRRWPDEQPEPYRPRSWGPASADRLFAYAGCHGGWRKPEPKS